MSTHIRTARRALAAAALTTALTVTLTACDSGTHTMPAMNPSAAPSLTASAATMASMPAMGGAPTGDGLNTTQDGYQLVSSTATLPGRTPAGYRFTITGPDGKPVTGFTVEQTKQMHFYAIRSDLSGFQHVHPTMATDGTWTAPLQALSPGTWRLFASFTPAAGPGTGKDLVLSRTVTVPGTPTTAPLPKASTATTIDGYTITVNGDLTAGMPRQLSATITQSGKPVTDLQPYLDTYAHLTAFHQGDLAFAHLHPESEINSEHGGPTLAFHADLAHSGTWRLFLQFQTAGTLHTAALTLHVA